MDAIRKWWHDWAPTCCSEYLNAMFSTRPRHVKPHVICTHNHLAGDSELNLDDLPAAERSKISHLSEEMQKKYAQIYTELNRLDLSLVSEKSHSRLLVLKVNKDKEARRKKMKITLARREKTPAHLARLKGSKVYPAPQEPKSTELQEVSPNDADHDPEAHSSPALELQPATTQQARDHSPTQSADHLLPGLRLPVAHGQSPCQGEDGASLPNQAPPSCSSTHDR